MNILAIETATAACAMGVATSAGLTETIVVEGERHHNEVLSAGLNELLTRVGLRARDVDRVVVDEGPGLYTGLRVGVATGLGLALGTNATMVGVTSLELLAYGAQRAGIRGTIVSCVDARRGEVFVQSFSLDDTVSPRDEPVVTTPSALVRQWRDAGLVITVTGDAVVRYEELGEQSEERRVFAQLVPPVREALEIATWRQPQATLVPLYLREPDAVANFTTRQRPR